MSSKRSESLGDLMKRAESEGINLGSPAAAIAFLTGDTENARIASTPGGIEAQEAAGARMVVESMRLPRFESGFRNKDSQPTLERLGIKVLSIADDLFYNVELPAGWKQELTGHSMNTIVVDERGRERISVFYKAAFYDRSAHLWLRRRFQMHTQPVGGYDGAAYKANWETCPRFGFITDGNTRILETTPVTASEVVKHYDLDEKVLYPALKAWLADNYPLFSDEFAYWDEPDATPLTEPWPVEMPLI